MRSQIRQGSGGTMEIDRQSDERIKAENARLRARVEELERRLSSGAAPRDAQRELADSVPYRALFDAVTVPLVVHRADGLLVAINRADCARWRISPEQIIGKYNALEDPQAVTTGHAEAFRRALAGEVVTLPPVPYDTEPGELYKDRRRLWTEPSYVAFEDASGNRFVAVVTIDVTARVESEAQRRRGAALLEAFIQNAPMLMFARDSEGRHTLLNPPVEALLGKPRQELMGKTQHDLFPAEIADRFATQDRAAMASSEPITSEDEMELADGTHVYMSTRFALRDEEGRVSGCGAIAVDITERVRAEARTRHLQEKMLLVQQETIRAISTPLLPIADGVLVAPLVGELTRERGAQFTETLLDGISRQHARITILDVTGVPQAGPEVTDALIRAARSARLLGAEVVLTGIRPSVAQALVELGADLGGIVTRGTLERGVTYALSGREGARPPARTRSGRGAH
ncbi:PAS domain-containing protein [Sorangium sp. So ce363]|uniref:PAS domain-containing protein n=1 Tax=Sorangium sp. So ce363 TaxID=3133304 RepID=UPI003F6188B0